MNRQIKDILFQYFSVPSRSILFIDFKNNCINESYSLIINNEKYLLQKLNKSTFTTIDDSTKLFAKMYNSVNIDVLNLNRVVKNKLGFLITNYENESWRLIQLNDDFINFNANITTSQAAQIGQFLGKLHKETRDIEVSDFGKKLANPLYIEHCIAEFQFAVQITEEQNIHEAHTEIVYLQDRVIEMQNLDVLANNEFKKSIIHGKPVVSNFVYTELDSDKLSLLNWDSMSVGTVLFDYAEMLRSIQMYKKDKTSNLDVNVAKVAYLQEMQNVLTPIELEHLDLYYNVLILAHAMQYLTAFLMGNKKIKATYFTENLKNASNLILLHRANCQQIYS